ncbi:MAG: OmpA family protein [Phycisphaera sp.]|nr:OmpA family protein [Phycisphaera sp.]
MMHILRGRTIWTLALLCVSLASVGCDSSQKTTQLDAYATENQELRNELTSTQQALEASEQDRARLVSEVATLQQQAASPAPAPAPIAAGKTAPVDDGFGGIGGGVSVEHRAGEIAVNVPGDVLFDPGKAELKMSAKSTLAKIASVIKAKHPGKTLRIEGYTDSDPIRKSKWTDNLELSAHRAMAVHRYLQQQGLSDDNMYIAGAGDNKPRATKAQSRRVEIVVLN